MVTTKLPHDNWDLRECGPPSAQHTVLLLSGALASGEFYEDVMAQPALSSMRLIAASIPGFAGSTPLEAVTIEGYATETAKLVADLGCDVAVGWSLGANIVLEMAAAKQFSGPVVLLSPSYSAIDEEKFFRTLAGIERIPVIGPPLWWAAMKSMPNGMKKMLPEARRDALVSDMKRNDPAFSRRAVREYFGYLKHHGEVASRVCEAGVQAWVVRGAEDGVSVQDDERKILESCPTVHWVEEPEGPHLLLVEHPDWVARTIAEAAAAT
jgi:pimeloyl-ACP methyl ester carboxylesterase